MEELLEGGAKKRKFGLSNNQLKLIAAFFMVIDHVGYFLMPYGSTEYSVCRSLGRIAFPIFAFCIVEGCVHTRNKVRYLSVMAGLAVAAELLFYVLTQMQVVSYTTVSIFTTLALGVVAVYLILAIKGSIAAHKGGDICIYALLLIGLLAIVWYVDSIAAMEYGFGGVCLIASIAVFNNKYLKMIGLLAGIGIIIILSKVVSIQVYMFLSLPFLLLYNGERGKWRMKYFFYVFYPVHVLFIILVGVIIGVNI